MGKERQRLSSGKGMQMVASDACYISGTGCTQLDIGAAFELQKELKR